MKITNNITQAYFNLMQSIKSFDDQARLAKTTLIHSNQAHTEKDVFQHIGSSAIDCLLEAQERFRVAVFTEAIMLEQQRREEGAIGLEAICNEVKNIKEELQKRYWRYNEEKQRHEFNNASLSFHLTSLTNSVMANSTCVYYHEMSDAVHLIDNGIKPKRKMLQKDKIEHERVLKKYQFILNSRKNRASISSIMKNHFIKAAFTSASVMDIVPIKDNHQINPGSFEKRFEKHVPQFLHKKVQLKSTNLLTPKNQGKLLSDIDGLIARMKTKKQECFFSASARQCEGKIRSLTQTRDTLFQQKEKGGISTALARRSLKMAKQNCSVHTLFILRALAKVLPGCFIHTTFTATRLDGLVNQVTQASDGINKQYHQKFSLVHAA